MEKGIVIGTEGKVDVKLGGGFVTLVAGYAGTETKANLSVTVSVDILLDKLAGAIPGQVDDAVITVLKAALKAI